MRARIVAIAVGTLIAALSASAPGAAALPATGPVFVVATSGDDAGPGSAALPWRTISHAARSVPPGARVDIRGGTYRERVLVKVSGSPGDPTIFAAHPGERVTISGKGVKGLNDDAGLIQVSGRSNLVFSGLELRDLVDNHGRFTPAGVWITGASSNIALLGLDIHGIRTTVKGGNAHGIAVYGSSGTAPITGITIAHNRVHDLKLGSSETVVLNGNVEGWQVVGNTIDNVDNIGIDAIGFERVAPSNDRARNGLIADNVISDVDTRGNPAYDTPSGHCRCAGAIYVDGGKNIVIERNRVTRSNLGVELASEAHKGATSDVVLRNNLVTLSGMAALTMGGYDTKRGKTERVQAVNNTFLDDDQFHSGTGEIVLNYKVLDSVVLNNVIRATPRGIMMTNDFRANSGNIFDGNVWYAPGKDAAKVIWYWRTKKAEGFDAWRRTSGADANGRYADPLLGDDARPQPGSPVIDAGVATPFAGATDLAGDPRLQGAALDAGALETTP